MKVHYDSDTFSNQTFGGISHYFVELMNHLPAGWDYSLSLAASENNYLKLLKKPVRFLRMPYMPDHRKFYHFINGIFDNRAIRRNDFDVFHTTGFNPYFLANLKRPSVATVHDMIYLRNYREGNLPRQIFESIEKVTLSVDHIIAISEATRRDLLETYPQIKPERVSVVHHGFSRISGTPARPEGLPDRYILFVGHRGGYKNFDVLLKAFPIIKKEIPDLQLVCTGRPFSRGERENIAMAGIADSVSCRFFDTTEMPGLYANASLFIFTSRTEGFGMPILEAMSAKTPVVLSRSSCFPEIAGEAGIYFDPDDPEELAGHVVKLLTDASAHALAVKKGEERLKAFSWEKTARQTAEVYQKLI